MWQRFKRAMRSFVGFFVSSIEDPELILEQNIRDMNDQVPKMNESIAMVRANQTLLEKENSKYKQELGDLIGAHAPGGAGGQEGRQFHVRQRTVDGVAHDQPESAAVQLIAEDLRADEARGFRRVGVAEDGGFIGLRRQPPPRGFRQRGAVFRQPAVARHHIQGGDDAPVAYFHPHAGLGRESLGSAHRRIRAQVDHRLLVGVDAGAHQEHAWGHGVRRHASLSGPVARPLLSTTDDVRTQSYGCWRK